MVFRNVVGKNADLTQKKACTEKYRLKRLLHNYFFIRGAGCLPVDNPLAMVVRMPYHFHDELPECPTAQGDSPLQKCNKNIAISSTGYTLLKPPNNRGLLHSAIASF